MINKVKNVMNSGKQIAYKNWLGEINSSSSQGFFIYFKQLKIVDFINKMLNNDKYE